MKQFIKIRYLLIIILAFYLWLPGSNTLNFHLDHGGAGDYISYNHLTDAFLSGKLHLLKEPDPRLLTLENPYDPRTRNGFGWHDASFYKEKFYLYFGITPVLLLYLPFKFFTGGTMTDRLASIIFMYGTFLWAVAILLFIYNHYFKEIEKWKLLLVIAVIGFSNWSLFIIREDNGIYNVAIACGLFFLIGAIYLFIKAIHEPNFMLLVLGSLFLGLAVGARANIILSGILLPLVWFKMNTSKDYKTSTYQAIALAAPFIICLSILALYNYSRFDNILEFGFKYQIGNHDFTKQKQLDLKNIPVALIFYLLSLPSFDKIFPYIHNTGIATFFPFVIELPTPYGKEPVVGLLTTVPFLLLPIFLLCSKNFFNKNSLKTHLFPRFEFLLIFLSTCFNFITICMVPATCMRYLAEVATFLILLATIFWFYFDSQLSIGTNGKNLQNKVAVLLSIISIIFWIGLGIDEIRIRNDRRSDFVRLESSFKAIINLLKG